MLISKNMNAKIVFSMKEYLIRPFRLTYRWGLPYLRSRRELPHLLNAYGLVGEAAEIGVQRGNYSVELLKRWKGLRLYSIDPWMEMGEEYVDISNVSQGEQEQLYEETVDNLRLFGKRSEIIRQTSQQAVVHFEDEQLDFVYIDAQHHYEAVKEDISLWWPKVKKGGLLAGHDYLDGVPGTGKYGVKTAVDEFVRREGLDLLVTEEKLYRSWLIFKP
ncbi:MAG: class I SAM-dependent methyltransferase [Bacteroidetes bacterium]|nr:class I SAM-dependent methyltransferase [Bacteroidota bacterium]